ncbi:MAG: NAD(P)-dependent oxidoreductase, partial [Thermofilaceae archaeon]
MVVTVQIAFFEIEGWEETQIRKALAGHDLIFNQKPLTLENTGAVKDSEIISVFIYSNVGPELLEKLPKLKAIITRSTGYDHIDLEACKNRGVTVFNVPDYGSSTVAEYTILLALMLMRKMKIIGFDSLPDKSSFSLERLRGRELAGKTIGIVGTGRIGSHVAKLAHAFGMKILAYDVLENEELKKLYGVLYVDLDALLSSSDIVTLHLPLTHETRHLINTRNITKIKQGAILINTSRGGLVETEALFEALDKGILAGAALDVVEGEQA